MPTAPAGCIPSPRPGGAFLPPALEHRAGALQVGGQRYALVRHGLGQAADTAGVARRCGPAGDRLTADDRARLTWTRAAVAEGLGEGDAGGAGSASTRSAWPGSLSGSTTRALATPRSNPSEGRLTRAPLTHMVLDPPPSRLMAFCAPSESIRSASSCSVMPTL